MHAASTARTLPRPSAPPIQPSADELVRTHGKLVHRLARQVFSRYSNAIAVEDLVQIGQIALIEASRAFVDRNEATFTTYATLRVRGAMIDMLRKSATITRDSMQRRRQFDHARQSLQGMLGRPPTDTEMAQRVSMAVDSYRAARAAINGIQFSSIDESYSDHNSWFTDDSPDAFALLDRNRQRKSLAAAIKTLPEREQQILQLFYVEELSLEEISKVFDVSSPRVCQIKKVALGKLQKLLNGRVDFL